MMESLGNTMWEGYWRTKSNDVKFRKNCSESYRLEDVLSGKVVMKSTVGCTGVAAGNRRAAEEPIRRPD
jgi:hypothetical protein